ncbi:unnamed protein product, partial [Mesorhabditis belari]|uniref:Uncharacterized protein n=1 Tax=Mesorhabditis belari TaxID=2138241 RepID=A0AAF3ENB0_9BILA
MTNWQLLNQPIEIDWDFSSKVQDIMKISAFLILFVSIFVNAFAITAPLLNTLLAFQVRILATSESFFQNSFRDLLLDRQYLPASKHDRCLSVIVINRSPKHSKVLSMTMFGTELFGRSLKPLSYSSHWAASLPFLLTVNTFVEKRRDNECESSGKFADDTGESILI